MRQFLYRHLPLTVLAAVLGLVVLWSMLAPVKGRSHQLLLAFPPGVTVSSMAVPGEIRLTRGVQDVLLLRNSDRVPIVFGPLKIAPGRDVRLPFSDEGVFEYVCPAGAGQGGTGARGDRAWPRLRAPGLAPGQPAPVGALPAAALAAGLMSCGGAPKAG